MAAAKQNFPTTEDVNYVFRLKTLLNYKPNAVVVRSLLYELAHTGENHPLKTLQIW